MTFSDLIKKYYLTALACLAVVLIPFAIFWTTDSAGSGKEDSGKQSSSAADNTRSSVAPRAGANGKAQADNRLVLGDEKVVQEAETATQHAAFKEQLRVSLEEGVTEQYGQLLLGLGASKDQLREVASIVVGQSLAMNDLLTKDLGDALPPLHEVEQIGIDADKRLRAVLGDQTYAAVKQFDRDQVAQRLVSSLDQTARSAGIAFSAEELNHVKIALAKEGALGPDSLTLSRSSAGNGMPLENPVITEARATLNPAQLAHLEKFLRFGVK